MAIESEVWKRVLLSLLLVKLIPAVSCLLHDGTGNIGTCGKTKACG